MSLIKAELASTFYVTNMNSRTAERIHHLNHQRKGDTKLAPSEMQVQPFILYSNNLLEIST